MTKRGGGVKGEKFIYGEKKVDGGIQQGHELGRGKRTK